MFLSSNSFIMVQLDSLRWIWTPKTVRFVKVRLGLSRLQWKRVWICEASYYFIISNAMNNSTFTFSGSNRKCPEESKHATSRSLALFSFSSVQLESFGAIAAGVFGFWYNSVNYKGHLYTVHLFCKRENMGPRLHSEQRSLSTYVWHGSHCESHMWLGLGDKNIFVKVSERLWFWLNDIM